MNESVDRSIRVCHLLGSRSIFTFDPELVLEEIAEHVLSLADVKRALDLIRPHKDDKRLLGDVMRLLRDRAALAGEDVRAGLEDLAAGRTVPLGDDLLAEIAAAEARGRRRSKSS